jgi:hypothetical protein
MELRIYHCDLGPKSKDFSWNNLRFIDFKPEVQAAIKFFGKGTFCESAAMGRYFDILPPAVAVKKKIAA